MSQNLTIESSPVRGNHVHIPFKVEWRFYALSASKATSGREHTINNIRPGADACMGLVHVCVFFYLSFVVCVAWRSLCVACVCSVCVQYEWVVCVWHSLCVRCLQCVCRVAGLLRGVCVCGGGG